MYEYCGLNVEIDGNNCVIHTLLGFLTTFGNEVPLSDKIGAIMDISSGINYLHHLKLIAGDIKPSNVLISGDYDNLTFKLSDLNFSTSSLLSTASMMSSCLSSDAVTYTLLYLAPELLSQNFSVSNTQNEASDIYALGMTIYQIMFPEEEIDTFFTPLSHMEAIKSGWRPKIPPFESSEDYPFSSILNTINDAWSEIPKERPSASQICEVAKLWKIYSTQPSDHSPSITKEATSDLSHIGSYLCKGILEEPPLLSTPIVKKNKSFLPEADSNVFKYSFEEPSLHSTPIVKKEKTNFLQDSNVCKEASKEIVPDSDSDACYCTPLQYSFQLLEVNGIVDNEAVVKDVLEQLVSTVHGAIQSNDVDFMVTESSFVEVSITNDSGLQIEPSLSIVNTDESVVETTQVPITNHSCLQIGPSLSMGNTDESVVETNKVGKNPKQRRKPQRLCIFCGKMFEKLQRHIRAVHKSVNRVANALKLRRIPRLRSFQQIRREGIIKYNKKEAMKENPVFQVERKRRKYMASLLCTTCSAFISKRFFSTHRRSCTKQHDKLSVGVPLDVEKVAGENPKLSSRFLQNVVAKLCDDELGFIIRNDEHILYLGDKFFSKIQHKVEKVSTVYKSVRADMRQLANLYRTLKTLEGFSDIRNNVLDMFVRDNFEDLCNAIDIVTMKEDKSLKAGMRHNLYYLLVKSVKRLRDRMFLEKKEELSGELDKFLMCVKSNEDIIVSSARYDLEKKKLKKKRRPCQLPLEEDMKVIRNFIAGRLEELCCSFEYWTSQAFIELRNLVMTRLTLLNGRRGGEVGRLLLDEWKDGENNGWIDQQHLKKLPPSEQLLVEQMKMIYLSGKGNRHLVSLLIPEDIS